VRSVIVESAAGRLVGRAPLVGSDGKVIRNGELPGVGINVAARAIEQRLLRWHPSVRNAAAI